MRILIATPRVLFPADTGGKIRSANMFRRLAQRADVTVACYRSNLDSSDAVNEMRALCPQVEFVDWEEVPTLSARGYARVLRNMASFDAFVVNKYHTRAMQDRLESLHSQDPYDVVVCDFLHMAKNFRGLGDTPRVLFQHNVEAVIRYRQFRETKQFAPKIFFGWDWVRLRRFERRAAKQFDHVVMVSEKDCTTMRDDYGVSHTSAVPLGVDIDYFKASAENADTANHLVFTGSMDWHPNEDCAHFFVDQIMPKIRERVRCKFWIVGRNPSDAVLRLSQRNADVEVTGRVEDIRPYLAKASVYVVPLRIGGGTRIKIFEAMAANRAVVSTTIGAEGLPLKHDENVILADGAAAFAESVVRLLEDASARKKLANAGHTLVKENYTWDVAAEHFLKSCELAARRGHAACEAT